MMALLSFTYFGITAYAFADRNVGGPFLIIMGERITYTVNGASEYEAFGIILVDWDGRPFRTNMRNLDVVLAYYVWGTIPSENGVGVADDEYPKMILWGQYVVNEEGEGSTYGPKPRGAGYLSVRFRGYGENVMERVFLYLSGRDRDSESFLRARGRILLGGWIPFENGYEGQPIHRINLNILLRGRVYELTEYYQGPVTLGHIRNLQFEEEFSAQPTDQIGMFRLNLRDVSREGTYEVDGWHLFIWASPIVW